MAHLFGPVLSRRLGRSLGIDLLPFKTCNLDCIYCECGATTSHTNIRADRVDNAAILAELDAWFKTHEAPDWLTFAGSGEPLLHASLEDLVREIRNRHPEARLALLTNALLFTDPAARRAAALFDLVLPSLDAARDEPFAAVNRPVPGITVAALIDGLVAFRELFAKPLWLEIFIVPGVNDTPDDIEALRAALARIRPERIQLNSLDRPGAVAGLRTATPSELASIATALGGDNIEIISRPAATAAANSVPEPDAEKLILLTVDRRPSTADDLVAASGLPADRLRLLLRDMVLRGSLLIRDLDTGRFYCKPGTI